MKAVLIDLDGTKNTVEVPDNAPQSYFIPVTSDESKTKAAYNLMWIYPASTADKKWALYKQQFSPDSTTSTESMNQEEALLYEKFPEAKAFKAEMIKAVEDKEITPDVGDEEQPDVFLERLWIYVRDKNKKEIEEHKAVTKLYSQKIIALEKDKHKSYTDFIAKTLEKMKPVIEQQMMESNKFYKDKGNTWKSNPINATDVVTNVHVAKDVFGTYIGSGYMDPLKKPKPVETPKLAPVVGKLRRKLKLRG